MSANRAKGRARAARGEDSGRAKLTELQAREAHRRVTAGERINAVAADFNISAKTLGTFVAGKTWKHLGLPKLKIERGGERNPAAKLSDAEVLEVAQAVESGETISAIALVFNVSRKTVTRCHR